jgi:hypothetical protein
MPVPTSRAFAVLLAALAACQSTTPVPPPPYFARPVVEIGRSAITRDGKPLGTLLSLRIEDPTAPVRFYRVVDPRGAWVGHITEQGRFTKRVPFADEEQDLGLWPMQKGIARLFDLDGSVDLKELPAAVPATYRKNS